MLVWEACYFSINFEWDPCWYSNLGCSFFPFSVLSISCLSLLAWRVFAERSAVKHIVLPLNVTCCFFLAAFNILSLCLVFVSLISMCLSVFLLGFILYGALCASWTWLTIYFSMLGKFSTIISSKILSYPFFFSSSGTPIIQMLVHLMWPQRSLRLSSVLFILFTLFGSSEVISTILCSSSPISSSASDTLLLIPSRVFLISVCCLSLYVYYLIFLGLC